MMIVVVVVMVVLLMVVLKADAADTKTDAAAEKNSQEVCFCDVIVKYKAKLSICL